ncbi:glucose-6-phosphate dehydrogenase [Roseiterribacter gracilis]|uniref:Glucose-6-phosphate 1-dehydrogenase n=1 Tax=Roseiterribacter gracilis TaxID=2812848 RepID=A0A8S8XEW9_9PROT|nr:glucose-6-phosphate 1-dehydrogenase [Rhodospirillales bacterium TMPK1]
MATVVPVSSFDFVVFGGTGDLAVRKLLPALYLRDRDKQLTADSRILLVSRSKESVAEIAERARAHIPDDLFDDGAWKSFLDRTQHFALDAAHDAGWAEFENALKPRSDVVRVFYLATAPDLFGPISARLKTHELITPNSRIVLEKPIGRDLASARAINEAVGAVFAEHQIFRIDHYLGKETVQNLLALRFANSLFESLWNRGSVDHVQITVAESIGVGTRAGYYDKSGALRDMVQNHLLQLLCLVAMEPPTQMHQDTVRDEKLKVLRALKPITPDQLGACTVRGQYRAGAIDGAGVPGYIEDLGGAVSRTETFVAIRAEVETWRWGGVPFYLRTGKRLAERTSEIVIQFRPVPHNIFAADAGPIQPNRLIIRLQPNEGIELQLMSKDPGPGGMRIKPTNLNLSFAEAFKIRYADAYERLLMDVVRGNSTLFMRRDEVEAAWTWIEPILEGWTRDDAPPKPYQAGTWGPAASIALIERDGRTWDDDGHDD